MSKAGQSAGREGFLTAMVDMARRAIDGRLGMRVMILDGGGDAVAELHSEGKVIATHNLRGVQLPLPGVVAAPTPPTATATATEPAAARPEVAAPAVSPTATAPKVADEDEPALVPCPYVLLSVVLHETVNVRGWALREGLVEFGTGAAAQWVCWHVEGGAPQSNQVRAVTVIRRSMLAEVQSALVDADITAEVRDDHNVRTGDSVLRVGGIVLRENVTWKVAAIAHDGDVLLDGEGGAQLVVEFAELATVPDGSGDFRVVPATSPPKKRRSLPVVEAPTAKASSKTAAKTASTKRAPKGGEHHRHIPCAAADRLAEPGAHTAVHALDGKTWVRELRPAKSTAPEWKARVLELVAAGHRVRLYNGGGHCSWDSLDGGSPS